MYARTRIRDHRGEQRSRAIAVPMESAAERRARRDGLLMTGLVTGLLLVLVLISSLSGVGP